MHRVVGGTVHRALEGQSLYNTEPHKCVLLKTTISFFSLLQTTNSAATAAAKSAEAKEAKLFLCPAFILSRRTYGRGAILT